MEFVLSCINISIHAPREGSDMNDFMADILLLLFLSTLPARGATRAVPGNLWRGGHFYPRSPRGERLVGFVGALVSADFYPRSPRGERRSTFLFLHIC